MEAPSVRPSQPDKSTVNWGPASAIAVVISVYFIGQILAVALLGAVGHVFGYSGDQLQNWLNGSNAAQLVYVALAEGLSVGLIALFLRVKKRGFRVLGLVTPKAVDLVWVLAGYAMYFVSYLLVLAAVKQFVPQLNLEQPQDLGFKQTATGGLVPIFVALVVLPPIVEEIMFRGVLFRGLRRVVSWPVAAVITSALFATAHLQLGNGTPLVWAAALDTFALSMVLTYLVERTGRLTAPIGLHMVKNGIAFAVLYLLHVR